MKSKLVSRRKTKKAFILVTATWILISIFLHILYVMFNSASYWPIYFISAMGISVGILGTIVFANEYEAKEEEYNQLHKTSNRIAPNNAPAEDRLELKNSNVVRVSNTDSEYV